LNKIGKLLTKNYTRISNQKKSLLKRHTKSQTAVTTSLTFGFLNLQDSIEELEFIYSKVLISLETLCVLIMVSGEGPETRHQSSKPTTRITRATLLKQRKKRSKGFKILPSLFKNLSRSQDFTREESLIFEHGSSTTQLTEKSTFSKSLT